MGIKGGQMMQIPVKMIVLLLTALTAFLVSGCGGESHTGQIADDLNLTLSGAEETAYLDDHGGFHGDGKTFAVLTFADDAVLAQIEGSADWLPLPMDETAQALVYGLSLEDGAVNIGPYFTDEDQNPLLPEIEDGYYRLIDRQMESGLAAPAMLERASLNFTIGVYDAGAGTLYYGKMDT